MRSSATAFCEKLNLAFLVNFQLYWVKVSPLNFTVCSSKQHYGNEKTDVQFKNLHFIELFRRSQLLQPITLSYKESVHQSPQSVHLSLDAISHPIMCFRSVFVTIPVVPFPNSVEVLSVSSKHHCQNALHFEEIFDSKQISSSVTGALVYHIPFNLVLRRSCSLRINASAAFKSLLPS